MSGGFLYRRDFRRRVYPFYSRVVPERRLPPRGTIKYRVGRPLLEWSVSYQSFLWYDHALTIAAPPEDLPEGQQAFARADRDVRNVLVEHQSFWWRDTQISDRFPDGKILLSRADEVVKERLQYQSLFRRNEQIPDRFPDGKVATSRADEIIGDRARSYQSLLWYDHAVPDAPVVAPPQGQQVFTRVDEKTPERTDRYKTYLWWDHRVSPLLAVRSRGKLFTRVDEPVSKRAELYRSFIDYNRRVPPGVPPEDLPEGQIAFTRTDERVSTRPQQYQTFAWWDHAVPDSVVVTLGGIYRPIFRPRRREEG